MFGENDVFGMQPQSEASQFEDHTPALPAPGQTGLPGNGNGGFQIPIGGSGGQQLSRPQQGGQPGAIMVPVDGAGGGMQPGGAADGWQWQAVEPGDTSQPAVVRSAGYSALLVALGVGIGTAVGGAWGAGAGLLLAGALANGYRTQKWWDSPQPSEKHEAVVSGVFAAAGIGVGGWLAYKAWEAKQGGAGGGMSKNSSDSDDEDESEDEEE
jgi:hypothetical protein